MQEPDPRTIASARRGDMSAFEELVRAYQADVWRLCRHVIRDEDLADDITQEAFVRVFRFLPRYRGESKFSTWLFSVVRNCAMDELRRAERFRRTSERVALEPPLTSPDVGAPIEVRDALGELSTLLREAIVLIDMLGLSYREAAEISGAPVGTVKSRVHQARRSLARLLSEEEGAGEA